MKGRWGKGRKGEEDVGRKRERVREKGERNEQRKRGGGRKRG